MLFKSYDHIIDKLCSKSNIHELSALIVSGDNQFSWSREYNKTLDTPLVMASISKLFTTTCILILREQGKLQLHDNLSAYLPNATLEGLHIYKGTDYSSILTISDLLFQTSGLPDYYLNGTTAYAKKILQQDFTVSFDEALATAKSMKPRFYPNRKNKAHYTDLNFDILGKIIEILTDMPLADAFDTLIFKPLDLQSTYIPSPDAIHIPKIYHKSQQLSIPKFLSSFPASGGGITTTKELMIFLKAFWQGRLFNSIIFDQLKEHHLLQLSFGGIHYAGGYMHINNGFPFGTKNRLLGHSGSTGSFAFYCPESDLFFVGDVNQNSDPSICIRLVMQLELCSRSHL